MQGQPNRFIVWRRDGGRWFRLAQHELEGAMFWARHFRERWGLTVVIDREDAPALRLEALELQPLGEWVVKERG